MRRNERQGDETLARELFTSTEWATLSLMSPFGPYAVPISPVLASNEDVIYFHSAPMGTKLDYLASDNRVTLSTVAQLQRKEEHFSITYQSAVAFGRAYIVEDAEEKEQALLLIAKKFAPSNFGQAPAYIKERWDKVSVVRIEIDSFQAKISK